MQITREVPRSEVATDWALWTSLEGATHAVLMDSVQAVGMVWVATDAATANTYARVNGEQYAARIVEDKQESHIVTVAVPVNVMAPNNATFADLMRLALAKIKSEESVQVDPSDWEDGL